MNYIYMLANQSILQLFDVQKYSLETDQGYYYIIT